VASDFVDHTPKGDYNRDSLKTMITMMKNSGTMKSEIKKELADDEYVMGWMHWTGTSNGSMPDMPAGPYDMNGIEVVRFKDGKAVEHWAFMDAREMMKMMSSMPASAPTSTDKAK
jgi:predicted SnoaL-like aldol condensation-catalyzing enzyme